MSTQTVILIGVAIYMVIMVGVGLWASRKTHNTVEFIVAGRSLPLWLCTTTIVATWFGGAIIIGGAGSAYEEGLFGVIADPFGGALCLFLLGIFFVRLFRRLKLLTFVDFVEQRFGRAAAAIATVASMFSNIMWVAGMLVAFAVVFEVLTGTNMQQGIVGGALVVVLYTTMGGMLAVAWTDFVQMIVIAVGLVVLLLVVLVDAGGWGKIAVQLPENTFRMYPLENSSGEVWLNYFRAIAIIGIADIASQTMIARALAAKSEDVAQKAFIIGTFGYIGIAMIPVMLGIIGSVTMPHLSNPESLIPAMAVEHLHPVFLAVFVGAVLAAIMSSCDSALLATSSLASVNMLPMIMRQPSERAQMRAVRWGIPIAGVIAVILALNAEEVFNTMLDSNLLILAAVIVPFILGVWWKKANRAGALAAMTAGIVSWLCTSLFYPDLPGDFIGLAVSLVTMLLVTPLTQEIDPPRELVDSDGNAVELTNRILKPAKIKPANMRTANT